VNTDRIKLGIDEVFILGDNWWRSIDSKEFGPLKIDDVVGKVLLK
jgi:signal peptidase I